MAGANVLICSFMMVLLFANVMPRAYGDCNVVELSPCAGAYEGGPPTSECCSVLKTQKSCYCVYARDPTYGPIIYSATGKRIANACGIAFPSC
uniref:Bifunctional inhibitor/plant lipid transfer protein/seed storage helical domain-containing protein n=1 Tax=Nymphaea colorata TaxID=210225 RepID=A0A5K0Y106_9MAGN